MTRVPRPSMSLCLDLVAHLRRNGIVGSVLPPGDPAVPDGAGAVTLDGRPIDLILPRRASSVGEAGEDPPAAAAHRTIRHPVLELHHVLRGRPAGAGWWGAATLRDDVVGVHGSEPIRARWVGGAVADRLNEVPELALRVAASGAQDVRVVVDDDADCVRIIHRTRVEERIRPSTDSREAAASEVSGFPSSRVLEALEGVARSVRERGPVRTRTPSDGPAARI